MLLNIEFHDAVTYSYVLKCVVHKVLDAKYSLQGLSLILNSTMGK